MFSWLDLKTMKNIYTDVHEHFKDDAFLMIVNHDGSVYSLKVDDIEALNIALANDLANAKGKNDIAKKSNIEKKLAQEFKKSTNLEKTFLKLYGNHGISLYKATDSNLSNWKQLELDENDKEKVNEIPCK